MCDESNVIVIRFITDNKTESELRFEEDVSWSGIKQTLSEHITTLKTKSSTSEQIITDTELLGNTNRELFIRNITDFVYTLSPTSKTTCKKGEDPKILIVEFENFVISYKEGACWKEFKENISYIYTILTVKQEKRMRSTTT